MAAATPLQVGDLMFQSFQNFSSMETAKAIAAEIGYNDSPFFGATKARVRLVGEVATVTAALTIVAVNQVFPMPHAKTIIDQFLHQARGNVFSHIEKKDSQFKARYEERLAQYFSILSERNPGLAVSFALMSNLGIDPIKSGTGQIQLSVRLGQTLTRMIAGLRLVQLRA